VFALTDLSDNKIDDHIGECPLLVFYFIFFFQLACFWSISFSESLGDPS
jgi:hypothetical protein